MVRHYQRKTNRGNAPKEALRAAAEAHLDGGLSLRKSATLNGVNYRTLARFVSLFEKNRTAENITIGYMKSRQVLNDDIERDMVEYAKKAAVIFHGITVDVLRQLAFRLLLQMMLPMCQKTGPRRRRQEWTGRSILLNAIKICP